MYFLRLSWSLLRMGLAMTLAMIYWSMRRRMIQLGMRWRIVQWGVMLSWKGRRSHRSEFRGNNTCQILFLMSFNHWDSWYKLICFLWWFFIYEKTPMLVDCCHCWHLLIVEIVDAGGFDLCDRIVCIKKTPAEAVDADIFVSRGGVAWWSSSILSLINGSGRVPLVPAPRRALSKFDGRMRRWFLNSQARCCNFRTDQSAEALKKQWDWGRREQDSTALQAVGCQRERIREKVRSSFIRSEEALTSRLRLLNRWTKLPKYPLGCSFVTTWSRASQPWSPALPGLRVILNPLLIMEA